MASPGREGTGVAGRTGSGGDQLRRAAGRWRALSVTARELEEFELVPTPGDYLQILPS